MPGFEDSAFIVLLALLLFGPKKLPELARQLGKLMADFRRASSEFRTQMEDELRISEQAERQKKLAAESSSTTVPALDPVQAAAVEAAYADQDLPPLEASTDAAPQTSLETAIASTPKSDMTPESSHSASDQAIAAPIYAPEAATDATPLPELLHG
jgi:sec-independent protein translocase protein TatB